MITLNELAFYPLNSPSKIGGRSITFQDVSCYRLSNLFYFHVSCYCLSNLFSFHVPCRSSEIDAHRNFLGSILLVAFVASVTYNFALYFPVYHSPLFRDDRQPKIQRESIMLYRNSIKGLK